MGKEKHRYASETVVSIGRSRAEVQKILTQWGCDGIRWTDDFRNDRVVLEFLWSCGGHEFQARMELRLPDEGSLKAEAIDGRTNRVSKSKLDRLMSQRGKREHRVLLLFLKGAFEAIEEGIITPEQIFLSYLVGKDGRTVMEAIAPRLPMLLTGNADRLLPGKVEQVE